MKAFDIKPVHVAKATILEGDVAEAIRTSVSLDFVDWSEDITVEIALGETYLSSRSLASFLENIQDEDVRAGWAQSLEAMLRIVRGPT